MKKYVKPELFYESFELSQQIASCAYDSNNTHSDERCVFTGLNKDFDVEMALFMDPKNGCRDVPESYCYHGNVGAEFQLFNS